MQLNDLVFVTQSSVSIDIHVFVVIVVVTLFSVYTCPVIVVSFFFLFRVVIVQTFVMKCDYHLWDENIKYQSIMNEMKCLKCLIYGNANGHIECERCWVPRLMSVVPILANSKKIMRNNKAVFEVIVIP